VIAKIRRVVLPALAGGVLGTILVVYFQRGFIPGDSFTYLAAGERLNAGHSLYALVPGDRPVDMHPPLWTVPFLSPPPMGVLVRPFALLPGDSGAYAWWAACLVAIGSVLVSLARRRPATTSIAVIVLSNSASAGPVVSKIAEDVIVTDTGTDAAKAALTEMAFLAPVLALIVLLVALGVGGFFLLGGFGLLPYFGVTTSGQQFAGTWGSSDASLGATVIVLAQYYLQPLLQRQMRRMDGGFFNSTARPVTMPAAVRAGG